MGPLYFVHPILPSTLGVYIVIKVIGISPIRQYNSLFTYEVDFDPLKV